jgi:excisionase family DNA binding protein
VARFTTVPARPPSTVRHGQLSPIRRSGRLLLVRTDPVSAIAHREDNVRTDPERSADVSGDRLRLTTEEAADVLRVGRTTVYALIKEGQLRPVHIGRSCRISHAELERYVSRLDTPPPATRARTAVDQPALFTPRPGRPSVGC